MSGGGVIRVWGCDYDTNAIYLAGLAEGPADLVHDEPYYYECRYRGRKEEAFSAVRAIPSAVGAVPFTEWDVLFIEHGFGANRKSDWSLGRVQGAITACVPERVAVNEIPVGEWRKRLTGKGGAKREVMEQLEREALLDKLGQCPDDGNMRAALGMAWVGRELNRAANVALTLEG